MVASDGELHRISVESIQVKPLNEFTLESGGPGQGSSTESWFDQLVEGDLNMFIALVSAMMILMGAVLIIRPKDRAAPEPWEMGTREVEIEEEMAREATGISEEEEIASTSALRTEDVESPPAKESPATLDLSADEMQSPIAPNVEVEDLMESEAKEVELDDLNEMADELDAQDIDVSFIDETIDDN